MTESTPLCFSSSLVGETIQVTVDDPRFPLGLRLGSIYHDEKWHASVEIEEAFEQTDITAETADGVKELLLQHAASLDRTELCQAAMDAELELAEAISWNARIDDLVRHSSFYVRQLERFSRLQAQAEEADEPAFAERLGHAVEELRLALPSSLPTTAGEPK